MGGVPGTAGLQRRQRDNTRTPGRDGEGGTADEASEKGPHGGDWKRQRDLGGRKAYRENTAAFGGQACSWSRSPVPVTTRSSAPPAGRTRPGNVHFSAHLLQGPV